MTTTLASQLPRINLANGGSMQSAQVVTLKSGQQNDLMTTSMSQYYVFTIQHPSNKNDAAQPGGCLTTGVEAWAFERLKQGLRRANG
jgi:hypothetical protein